VSSVLAPEIPPFSGIAVRSVSNPKNGSVQVGRLKEISSLTAMPNEEATAETTQWHGTPRTRATTIREDVETVTDGVPQNQRQTDIKSNGAHLVAELQFQAREAPSQVLAGLDPLAGWPATQQDGALKPTGGMSHANPHGSAETARSIATQILPIVTQGKPGTSEIALNPQELGRVRIHLTPVDQTMTISILSERPETADLMRRHGDMLVQEFRSIGYSDVRLDFGQMGQRQPGQDQSAEQTPSGSRARQQGDQDIAQGVADIPTGLRRAHPRGEGSLDLRL
jgi:flagellar hook-length control protein FliK